MSRRKMQNGICRICKKRKDLSFEHIPPKVAFNKYTKFRSIPFLEYVQNSHKEDYKPSGKLHQGGLGRHCLCRSCNSFLGTNYVPEYFKMSQVGMAIFKNKTFEKVNFITTNISPLRFLKQVIAMFVCINDSDFTNNEPELLKFIKDPKEQYLPNKFRVFMYLNNVGQIRYLTKMFTNTHGYVNELTFPPFGFVLSLDPNYSFPLTEITHFKTLDENYIDEIHFELLNLPTHLPFPVDYRTLEEIEETRRENIKFEEIRNNQF